jgi:Fur family ferric uptake transcriptional regulator
MLKQRNTPQRNAIETTVRQSKRPLSVDEILVLARKQVATLDQATVYRNLKRFIEEGWLIRVATPDHGVFYELAEGGHHHHFHCRDCERIFDMPGCGLNSEKQAPSNFQVEDHDVFLYGLCPDCSRIP